MNKYCCVDYETSKFLAMLFCGQTAMSSFLQTMKVWGTYFFTAQKPCYILVHTYIITNPRQALTTSDKKYVNPTSKVYKASLQTPLNVKKLGIINCDEKSLTRRHVTLFCDDKIKTFWHINKNAHMIGYYGIEA